MRNGASNSVPYFMYWLLCNAECFNLSWYLLILVCNMHGMLFLHSFVDISFLFAGFSFLKNLNMRFLILQLLTSPGCFSLDLSLEYWSELVTLENLCVRVMSPTRKFHSGAPRTGCTSIFYLFFFIFFFKYIYTGYNQSVKLFYLGALSKT